MSNLLPLLRPGYWFSIQTVPFLSWSSWFVLGVMIVLLMASIGLWLFARSIKQDKERRRVFQRLAHLCLWAGIVGLMLYGLTWLRVPVLSMRFFFVIWFMSFGYWAWVVARYVTRELPELKKEAAERAAYEKWLPKPKK